MTVCLYKADRTLIAVKKQDTWAMLTLQGSQTEGGDLAQAVSESEEGKEKEENMYTFHLFQFKEVSYGDKVQS